MHNEGAEFKICHKMYFLVINLFHWLFKDKFLYSNSSSPNWFVWSQNVIHYWVYITVLDIPPVESWIFIFILPQFSTCKLGPPNAKQKLRVSKMAKAGSKFSPISFSLSTSNSDLSLSKCLPQRYHQFSNRSCSRH